MKEGFLDYEKQLKWHGLSGTYLDILGGGNWSFTVQISRVLEEFCKLISIEDSETFKYIRYELYNLEIVLTKITSNSK